MDKSHVKNLQEGIKNFIPFAVPEKEQQIALQVVEKYKKSELVLRLLHDYYTALPDACEEAVSRISELDNREGVHLFVLCCTCHNWLYAVTVDDVALIAEYGKEIPKDVALFFGYDKSENFLANYPAAEDLDDYPQAAETQETHCPACGVLEGEEHLPGCVVEICPWCDGQLQSCNCRFEKLELAEIKTEKEVEEFLDILQEKGRIPFHKDHAPNYPGTSKGLDYSNKIKEKK